MARAGRQRALLGAICVAILLSSAALSGCSTRPGPAAQIDSIVRPYRFGMLGWSLGKILLGDEPLPESRRWAPNDPAASGFVLEYYALVEECRALRLQIGLLDESEQPEAARVKETELEDLLQRKIAMRDTVEWILGRQIQKVLDELGVHNPVDRYVPVGATFPPVNFELDQLPHLLVVSPRERIERAHEVMLIQYLGLETMEDIERRVDALGFSSLVVGLGGFGGTYPTFVADDASLDWTISTAVEEWLHQYLAFTPLGLALVKNYLGWQRDPDIGTLNETVAGIISQEIGDAVLEAYYPDYAQRLRSSRSAAPQVSPDEFDFAGEMRKIRLAVEALLADGMVEQAEAHMEESRQRLGSEGYYIRKLNQAYFAFYGSYAYEPTSVDPLGGQLTELRRRSASLKAFLDLVSVMTDRKQVLEELEGRPSADDGLPAMVTAQFP